MNRDQWREALARAGVSQNGLARTLGRDPSTVRRWIAGANAAPPEAEMIVDLLGTERITLDDLQRKPKP